MNDIYMENEGLELLDAMEIGFDLSDYDSDTELCDEPAAN